MAQYVTFQVYNGDTLILS
jgi:hypothetical protein